MAVAVVAIWFGMLVAMSLIVPDFISSKNMDRMLWCIVRLVSGFLGTKGVLMLIGLNWNGDNVSRDGVLNSLSGGSLPTRLPLIQSALCGITRGARSRRRCHRPPLLRAVTRMRRPAEYLHSAVGNAICLLVVAGRPSPFGRHPRHLRHDSASCSFVALQ